MCVQSQTDFRNHPVSLFGGMMLRISLPYIYDLSTALQPLGSIAFDTQLKDSLYPLLTAENSLNGFLADSVYTHVLKASKASGFVLLQAVKKLTTDPDKDRTLDFIDTYSLSNALKDFETVLAAELNVTDVYLVTKKRGYDTLDLISQAEVLFPQDLPRRIPEAVFDLREAGKCIAFELGTAAGYHIMRATELVLRQYYDAVMSGAERPKSNNIGDYLREMDESDAGDAKTRAALRQIKDLHRNELMHPDVTLSLDDAIALLGIAQSAIIAMLREMPGHQLSLAGSV